MLDLSTLVAVSAGLQLLMTGVLAVARHFNPQVPGITLWSRAYVLLSLSLLLIFLRPQLPQLFSDLIAALLILYAYVLTLQGFRHYQGEPPIPGRPVILLLVAYAGIRAYVTMISPDYALRVFFFCVFTGLVMLDIARQGLRPDNKPYPARRFFGLLAGLHGLFTLTRGVVVLMDAESFKDSSQAHWLTLLTYSEAIAITVLFALSFVLLTAEHLSERLHRLSEIDPLTQVFNRRSFTDLFDKAASRARRHNATVALLAVDFDHFKHINDSYGHEAGDQVLAAFARTARQNLRNEDVLARMGGEEFSVLLPDTDRNAALAIAERLRAACETTVVTAGRNALHFTVSIGVAVAPPCAADELMRQADRSLYQAKHEGRNRVACQAPSADTPQGLPAT